MIIDLYHIKLHNVDVVHRFENNQQIGNVMSDLSRRGIAAQLRSSGTVMISLGISLAIVLIVHDHLPTAVTVIYGIVAVAFAVVYGVGLRTLGRDIEQRRGLK